MPRKVKVHWHPGNRQWYANCGPPGKDGRAKAVYCPRELAGPGDERAAWAWLDGLLRAEDEAAADLSDPTVFAACQAYLAWMEGEADAGRVARAHYRARRVHLKRLCEAGRPPLGGRKCRRLAAADLEAALAAWRAEGRSEHYVADIGRSVRAAFNWAVAKGLLERNPVAGAKVPRPPRSPDRYLERAAGRAFLAWAFRRARAEPRPNQRWSDVRFVRLVQFVAMTGCRPAEACHAEWSRVDRRHGVIVLEEWKNRRATGELREIVLTPPSWRLLGRLERRPGRHRRWIFTHRRGKGAVGRGATAEAGEPWNSVAVGLKLRKWREEAIRAGVPIESFGPKRFTAYLLRHTYASDALMAGASIAATAKLMGTSPQQVQDTYGHVQRRHLRDEAERIERHRRGDRGA